MATKQIPSSPMKRVRAVHRTAYPARIEAAIQFRIKEGSDFGEFLSEWHRLLGPIAGIHKVLCCDDLTVRNWLHHGQAPSASIRQLMRNATRDMKPMADGAWAEVRSDDIAAYMHS